MSLFIDFGPMSAYIDSMEPLRITEPRRLGAALRARRENAGLSQATVAARAGVSRAWLIRFEDGHHRAELGHVFAVLRALEAELVLRDAPLSEEDREAESYLKDLLG